MLYCLNSWLLGWLLACCLALAAAIAALAACSSSKLLLEHAIKCWPDAGLMVIMPCCLAAIHGCITNFSRIHHECESRIYPEIPTSFPSICHEFPTSGDLQKGHECTLDLPRIYCNPDVPRIHNVWRVISISVVNPGRFSGIHEIDVLRVNAFSYCIHAGMHFL